MRKLPISWPAFWVGLLGSTILMSCIHHETFPQFLLRTAIVGIVCCALVAVIEIVWTFGYWIYKRLAGK